MLTAKKQKNIQYIINQIKSENFMKTKNIASTRYFYLALTILFFLFFNIGSVLIAQEVKGTETDSGFSFGDIIEFIMITGYIGGVFVLLPWVIYTNLKEGLSIIKEGSTALPNSELSEDERNSRATKILEEIDNRLTRYEEEGEEMITITKGSQARFTRKGLAYISNELITTDLEIISRANELIVVYQNRSRRLFTGSNWIIGSAVALLVIFIYQTGISNFVIIHLLGIIFYVLSSRTPMYILEKRMNRIASVGSGIIGSVLNGLFVSSAAKSYKVYSDGSRKRDYESEFSTSMIYYLIIAIVSLFLGFFTAALGVVNFLMNYMNNALIPMKPETWYKKNFVSNL